MEADVRIESQSYLLNAQDDLHNSLKATIKRRWPVLLALLLGGGAFVRWGFVVTEPGLVALGLMLVLMVPMPFIRLLRYFRKADPAYERIQKVTISGGEFRLTDDVGNARVKPLNLLAKVETQGIYVRFTFSDQRVIAVPLSAFSQHQVVEIQDLVATLETERQKSPSTP